jgi:hypothetical protein
MTLHNSESWLKKWELRNIFDYAPWQNEQEEQERDWNNWTIIEHAPPKNPHSEHSKDCFFEFDCCYPSGSKEDDVSISNESLISGFSSLESYQLNSTNSSIDDDISSFSELSDQPKSTSGFDSNQSVSSPSKMSPLELKLTWIR